MGRIKTQSLRLPRKAEAIVALFRRVLRLPRVSKIEVSAEEFSVTRLMESETEPVIPDQDVDESLEDSADLGFILAAVADQLEEQDFDPGRDPYTALAMATAVLCAKGLTISALAVRWGPLFSDYFGLPEGSMPETFMGIRVIYHNEQNYPDKIVVFAGPSSWLSDASHGVIIETGA